MRKPVLLIVSLALVWTIGPIATADASYLVGRNLRKVELKVSRDGQVGLVNYQIRERGRWRQKHLLAWGAINAVLNKDLPEFKVDRTGGWKSKGRRGHWKTFKNACKRYTGPREIKYVLRKCTVTFRGKQHHWTIQRWARVKPNYGGTTGPMEYRLSHWAGPIPKLEVWTDWADNRYDPGTRDHALHVFGRYTYRGRPVYGYEWTRTGYVLDGRGRNITLESLNSNYPGTARKWARVNMFLSNAPNGQFCFLLGPKTDHGGLKAWQKRNLQITGRSSVERYRMGVAGPGVAPDAFVGFRGRQPGSYDPKIDAEMDRKRLELRGSNTGHCDTD